MKKKLFAILFAVVIMVASFGVVAHAETKVYVLASDAFMEEEYMSIDELTELQKKGFELEDEYGYAVMFVILDETLYDYYESAQSLYFELTDNPDGILIVDNYVDDEFNGYFAGECEELFGDQFDTLIEIYEAADTYYDGINDYFTEAESFFAQTNDAPVDNGDDNVYVEGDTDNSDSEDVDVDVDVDSEDADVDDKEEMPYVLDNAGIFKDAEIKELDEKYRQFSKDNSFDFIAVTLTEDELGDLSIEEYSDNMYNYVFKPMGKKDIAFYTYLHGDEGEREIVITRYGTAKEELSDEDCDKIINNVKATFADGKYVDGFNGFIEETESVFHPTVHWVWIPVCLVLGFVIAFIIMKGVASANKSVRKKVNATDYVRGDSLTLTGSSEVFMYSELKTSAKSNNNTSSSNTDGGGRSTSSGKF